MSDFATSGDEAGFFAKPIKPWHAVGGAVLTLGMLGAAKLIVDDHRTHRDAASAICHAFQQRAQDGVREGKTVPGELRITGKHTGVAGGFTYRCPAPVAGG